MELGLIDVAKTYPQIQIEMRYATTRNFTQSVLYDSDRCYLRREVAERLAHTHQQLEKDGFGLKIWDAYRPKSVQYKLWEVFPDDRYVAHPDEGSVHSRGAAVDLTLVDAQGRELPMPTHFDDFTEKAHHGYPHLPTAMLANRERLKTAMTHAGFLPIPNEWWHYNDPEWTRYDLLDVSLGELEASQKF